MARSSAKPSAVRGPQVLLSAAWLALAVAYQPAISVGRRMPCRCGSREWRAPGLACVAALRTVANWTRPLGCAKLVVLLSRNR